MKLSPSIDRFFFEPIVATNFGLMRVAWAGVTLLYLIFQRPDVAFFYSRDGIIPPELLSMVTREEYRFSLFDWIQDPAIVFAIYGVLLLTLFLVMIGYQTRLMMIISVVVLFSFHERNLMILGGGDTLLRTIGFILMISPSIHAFSVDRLRAQWPMWKQTRLLPLTTTMPIWPWRLLLWQLVILYITSLWYKLLGTMWWEGTAIDAVMHHPVFARWPTSLTDLLLPFNSWAVHLTLIWEALWIFLLVPRPIVDLLPKWMRERSLRRWLMLGGVLFHGGIFLLLDAGVFSLAIFVAYLGLLREEDFDILRSFFNRTKQTSKPVNQQTHRIAVLYDDHCGLCIRSVFWLAILNHLRHLQFIDFRDAARRKTEAPDLTEEALDKALHIKLPNDTYKTGFDAFRRLAWHLPVFWIIAPFLYIPGIPFIGRRVYETIADRRKRCTHENCGI